MIGKIINVRCALCGGPLEVAPSLKNLICREHWLHPNWRYYTTPLPVDLQLRIMHQPELPGLDAPELRPDPARKGVTVVSW